MRIKKRMIVSSKEKEKNEEQKEIKEVKDEHYDKINEILEEEELYENMAYHKDDMYWK